MTGFIGIDAGGTKTDFKLSDEHGHILSSWSDIGCRLLADSPQALQALLSRGVSALLQEAGMPLEQIGGACLGISGYGESVDGDEMARAVCESIFGKGRVICTNDCRIAWAGSLGMQPGVNIIAGTGSIAYGENEEGESARSGGWGAIFDEGSCRWIGEALIQTYTKQADGRLPRTALYEAFRRRESITSDEKFIAPLNHGYLKNVRQVASLQRLCLELWQQGDPHAYRIYGHAAQELALAASAVANHLNMTRPFKVSYAGGLFHAGEAIMKPFVQQLEQMGGTPVPPIAGPAEGAASIARYQALADEA